jgi:hypothetical protein
MNMRPYLFRVHFLEVLSFEILTESKLLKGADSRPNFKFTKGARFLISRAPSIHLSLAWESWEAS